MAAEPQIKRKHRFNGFDLFIIICIVAVIAVAIIVFVSPVLFGKQIASGKKVDIVYRLRIQGILNEVDLDLQENNTLYEIVRSEPIGTIESFTVEPTKYVGRNTLDGSVTTGILPNRKTLYITVRTQAEIDHDQYYIGEQEVYVGADITVRTKGFTGYMTVVDLQEVQADE